MAVQKRPYGVARPPSLQPGQREGEMDGVDDDEGEGDEPVVEPSKSKGVLKEGLPV